MVEKIYWYVEKTEGWGRVEVIMVRVLRKCCQFVYAEGQGDRCTVSQQWPRSIRQSDGIGYHVQSTADVSERVLPITGSRKVSSVSRR